MNYKIHNILLVSILFNILFLFIGTLFITNKGGSYISAKISNFVVAKTQALEVATHPYYFHQNSLFQIMPKSNSDIIFLGDSLTDECEWAELFDNPNIKNRGISGDTTIGVLNRLDDILQSKPQKIFLLIGINDLIQSNTSVEQLISNYKKIIAKIQEKSPKTQLFIQSLLPVNKTKYKVAVDNNKIMQVNLHLKTLATQFSLTYIDLFSQLADTQNQLDSRYTLDGLHLNGQAYSVWKKSIEKYIVDG